MANYYHIMFEASGVSPTSPELEKKFDLSLDWYRYRRNCWIVYTTSDAEKWYSRLGPLAKKYNGNVFIVKLDITDRQGWISKKLWEWIKKEK